MDKELFTYYKASLMCGLCNEYKGLWRKAQDNKQDLFSLAMCQQSIPHFIHHAYNGDGINSEYLKKEFGDFINRKREIRDCDGVHGYTYAMYVDKHFVSELIDDVNAFLWCKGSMIYIKETKCPFIYVGCNSNIHLVLDGYNSIRIYLFDDSCVELETKNTESTIVTVFKYSKNCVVKKIGNIKVNEYDKELRL